MSALENEILRKKMDTLCKIRDIYRSIIEFETRFEKVYDLCLNEGMLLCSLANDGRLSSGEIAERLGISPSNTSKVIKSVETKGLIERILGDKDKRQMYFKLTPEGDKRIRSIKCNLIDIQPILENIVTLA